MPLSMSMVGYGVEAMVHEVDKRWTMAFAAALGDHLGCYMDTSRAGGIVAHPVFPVCPEWPVIVSWRDTANQFGLTPEEVGRGIHATHDLTIHRLVRPGDRLRTTMTIIGVEQRKPGAYSTVRLETIDANDKPVSSTVQGMLYLGVRVDGPESEALSERPDVSHPILSGASPVAEIPIPIAQGAAHTYTECARIWNPIHTDVGVARAAGLSGNILHGTATLAHAVSTVVEHYTNGDPGSVRRVVGRFGAMVPLPSTIIVRLFEPVDAGDGTRTIPFEVRTEDGAPAIDRAAVMLG